MVYRDEYSTRHIPASDEQAGSRGRRFLVSALLLFVAKGDGNISGVESTRMIDLLSSRMNIRNAEALDSLTEVLNALQDDANIARKLRDIAARLTARQKREILDMMLDVAAVDDVRDEGETEAIDMATRILDMSQSEIGDAYRAHHPVG